MQFAKTEIQHIVEALIVTGRGKMPHARRKRNERLLRRFNAEWRDATAVNPGADIMQKPLIELHWIVATTDTSTGTGDDESGAIEVARSLLEPCNRHILRKRILEDFEERGSMFEDWAYGDLTTVQVELPDIGWETI